MAEEKKEKGFFHRFWQNVAGTEEEEEEDGNAWIKRIAEADLEDEEEIVEEFINGEAGDDKTVTDRMETKENYLEAIRRGITVDEMPEDAVTFYSNFTIENREPSDEEKEYLTKLQATAKAWFEAGSTEDGGEKPVNAQVGIKVAPDFMTAWVFYFPPKNGGKDISEELVQDALEQLNVVCGTDDVMIHRSAHKKAYLKLIVAARGTLPRDGVDGEVTDHFPRILRSNFEALAMEDGSIDYSKMDWLHAVREGEVICDIKLPKRRRDGRRIDGEVIPAADPKPFFIPQGSNTELNEEHTALVSCITGSLYFEDGVFHAKDVLNVTTDVDASVGNIDTVGDLEIKGDILSGFKVQATGNITVRGMVGNSVVIAGGNIKIGMGIRGFGGAVLSAGGKLDCGYMENCKARARGAVTANSIINCDVTTDNNIECTSVVGGSLSALRQIHVRTVGNKQRRPINISLGSTQEFLKEKIYLENHLEELDNSLRQLTKNIRFLTSKGDHGPKDAQQLEELKKLRREQTKDQEKCEKRLRTINEGIQDYSICEMTADLIYPPMTIAISSDVLMVDRQQNMCRIWADNGEIAIS